jgi:RNA polymerase sigma factor (sigma-70 family)
MAEGTSSGRAGEDENTRAVVAILATWDPVIHRNARRITAAAGGDIEEAADLAQEARFHLARIARVRRDLPSPYLRRVISNSLKGGARRRRRGLSVWSPRLERLADDPLPLSFEGAHAPAGPEHVALATWVARLPKRLGDVYELLYVHGCSQREAARGLRVSQPRVAQLHHELLRLARRHISRLAV